MRSLLRVALRNVMRNRRRSLLTLSAVFLAVGVMVSVRGLLNGLHASIREGVIYGQMGALQVHRKGFLKAVQASPLDLDLPADDAFIARITAVPGVTGAAPRINFGGMINANDITVFALFFALDPVREPGVCPRRKDAVAGGKLLDPALPDGADLSNELIKRIGAKAGDKVVLLTNDHEGVLNATEVSIIGNLSMSMPLPDKKIAYVPLAAAQQLLRMEGRATEIAVAVDHLEHIEEIRTRLAAAVGPEYEVSTWHEVASFIDELVAMQNLFIGIILYTFLFIALLGIANAMLLNVLERTREIGTMMAVGMRRRQILMLFLLEAALVGLVGGVGGAAVGGGIVGYYHSTGLSFTVPGSTAKIPITPFITASYILFTFALAAGGAALSALYPAWMASRLRPIEALSRA